MRLTGITAVLLIIAVAFAMSTSSAHAATTTTKEVTKKTTIAKSNTPIINPPTNQVQTIVVSPGDNLSELAALYNTTMLRLFYANLDITNPDLIFPGEAVVIPSVNEVLTPRALPAETTSIAAVTPEPSASIPATSAPAPNLAPSPAPAATDTSVWYELAECESGGNWAVDSGNGFYGGLQFTLSSWQAVGGTGYPNQASEAEQISLAEQLQSTQGWAAWPVCSAKLGL